MLMFQKTEVPSSKPAFNEAGKCDFKQSFPVKPLHSLDQSFNAVTTSTAPSCPPAHVPPAPAGSLDVAGQEPQSLVSRSAHRKQAVPHRSPSSAAGDRAQAAAGRSNSATMIAAVDPANAAPLGTTSKAAIPYRLDPESPAVFFEGSRAGGVFCWRGKAYRLGPVLLRLLIALWNVAWTFAARGGCRIRGMGRTAGGGSFVPPDAPCLCDADRAGAHGDGHRGPRTAQSCRRTPADIPPYPVALRRSDITAGCNRRAGIKVAWDVCPWE